MTKSEIIKVLKEEEKEARKEMLFYEKLNERMNQDKEDSFSFITSRAKAIALWELMDKLNLKG